MGLFIVVLLDVLLVIGVIFESLSNFNLSKLIGSLKVRSALETNEYIFNVELLMLNFEINYKAAKISRIIRIQNEFSFLNMFKIDILFNDAPKNK